jgi:aspartyl-tRNA(Asn)/glutamyl-tRNA(Gln) amidotransferase subunit C
MPEPKISLEETRHVAELARLALTDSEIETMRGHLDAILEYMTQLEELDVTGIEPTFYSISMQAPLRADLVKPSLPHDEALRAAPKQSAGAFSVPKIME